MSIFNTQKKFDKRVELFLKDIEKVCKEHNLSISHEDSQGAFIIEEYDDYNMKWLKGESVNTR